MPNRPRARLTSMPKYRNCSRASTVMSSTRAMVHLSSVPGELPCAYREPAEARAPVLTWSLVVGGERIGRLGRKWAHFGIDPSTPSTYQLIAIRSSIDTDEPAATFSAPPLSLIGPANGSRLPAM